MTPSSVPFRIAITTHSTAYVKNNFLSSCALSVHPFGSSCDHHSPHAITTLHTYQLGEAGSISGNLPQDGTGSAHFTNAIGGGQSTGTTGVTAPGSTTYSTFTPNQGNYGADFSALPTDNFAIELWAQTSNPSQTNNAFFTTDGIGVGMNPVKFHVHNSNWAISIDGLSWVGISNPSGSTAQSISSGTWTHLAYTRESGTSTFYINGVAQPGTTGALPTNGVGHIGVNPGGSVYYDGSVDEVRIFTFDPLTDDPVSAFNLVPEPSSSALLALGLTTIFRRRR